MIPLYSGFSFTGFEGLAVRCSRLMHTPGMRWVAPYRMMTQVPPGRACLSWAPGSLSRPGSAAPSWPLLLLHRLTYRSL